MCGSVRARVRRLPISLVLSLSSECINMRLHCYCVVKYIQLDNSWRIFSTSILSLFLVSFHCFSSQSFCDRNSKISETFSWYQSLDLFQWLLLLLVRLLQHLLQLHLVWLLWAYQWILHCAAIKYVIYDDYKAQLWKLYFVETPNRGDSWYLFYDWLMTQSTLQIDFLKIHLVISLMRLI